MEVKLTTAAAVSEDGWADVGASATPATPLCNQSGYLDRVDGCLLGKMCGDVLGAGVEGWDAQQVLTANPEGLTDFLHTERGFGCYTDDTQMAIALARSLVATGGRVDDVHAARSYAEEYQAHRGYGGTAFKILSSIKRDGIDADSIKTIGTKYIPSGSFGNGGAMRIAPLGLVYRHAPPAVLREAVAAALRCTHVHPVAIDGAFVIALAVGYLAARAPGPALAGPPPAAPPAASSATPPAEAVATPMGLLDHVLSRRALLATEGMAHKVEGVMAALLQNPRFKGEQETWGHYFASPAWAAELALQQQVAEPFQIRADDAAAAALGALCWHWGRPQDAVVAAVHYGGDTDTVAAITGAMAGALYGTRWLPTRWLDHLENGPAGRDEVLQLGATLARYDTRT